MGTPTKSPSSVGRFSMKDVVFVMGIIVALAGFLYIDLKNREGKQ